MGRPYRLDLRERVVEAVAGWREDGTGSPASRTALDRTVSDQAAAAQGLEGGAVGGRLDVVWPGDSVLGMPGCGGEDAVWDGAACVGLGSAGHGVVRSRRQRGAGTERTPRLAACQRGWTGLRVVSGSHPQQCVLCRHSPGQVRCVISETAPCPQQSTAHTLAEAVDPFQTFRRSATWKSDRTRMTEGGRKPPVRFGDGQPEKPMVLYRPMTVVWPAVAAPP